MKILMPECRILGLQKMEGKNQDGSYTTLKAKVIQYDGYDTDMRILKIPDEETMKIFTDILERHKLTEFPLLDLRVDITEWQGKSYFSLVGYQVIPGSSFEKKEKAFYENK